MNSTDSWIELIAASVCVLSPIGVWFQEIRARLMSQDKSKSESKSGDRSLFDEASRLVKTIEAQGDGKLFFPLELERKCTNPVLCSLWGSVSYLLWILQVFVIGGSIKVLGFTNWLAFFLSLLLFYFVGVFFFEHSSITTFSYSAADVALFVTSVLLSLSRPSLYGNSGVTSEGVEAVVNHLETREFKTAKEIELLKKSVKQFEDRTRSRVTALKWIVGVFWLSFYATFPKYGSFSQLPLLERIYSFNLLTLTTLLFLTVLCYEASVDILFRTIEFGCNDFCYRNEIKGLP